MIILYQQKPRRKLFLFPAYYDGLTDNSCIFAAEELKRVQDGFSEVHKSLPAMP